MQPRCQQRTQAAALLQKQIECVGEMAGMRQRRTELTIMTGQQPMPELKAGVVCAKQFHCIAEQAQILLRADFCGGIA